MRKITKKSYSNALQQIIGCKLNYKLYVLSDVKHEWKNMIDHKYIDNAIHVDEDDISQMHIAMNCDYFVCSESTYHYIIALFAYLTNPGAKIIVFNNTDLTNRKHTHLFSTDDWIRIDYS
jgi:hypothetical protein